MTKKTVAVYIRNTLIRINNITLLTDESTLFYVRSILELCTKYELHSTIIDQLALSLIQLLVIGQKEQMQVARARFFEIIPYIKQILESFRPTHIPINGLSICVGQILTLMFDFETLEKLVLDLVISFESVLSKEWTNLINTIKSISETNNDFKIILKSISGITEWFNVSLRLFNNSKYKRFFILKHYFCSEFIPTIVVQSLQLIISIGEQTNNTFLSCTGNLLIDIPLNEMKNSALHLTTEILSYIYVTSFASKASTTNWYSLCRFIGEAILSTLLKICVTDYDKLEDRCRNLITSKFITRLLCVLNFMLEENSFYSLFSSNRTTILVDIIFILIKATQDEKLLLTTDPQEFVNLGLNTCDNQKSRIPKTEAAKLMESICEHIDGSIAFLVSFCYEAMLCATSKQPAEEIEKNPLLGQFKKHFLTKCTPEEIIETCLVVISCMSYSIITRNDSLLLIDNLMKQRFSVLFISSSTFIRCRMGLFLEYYLDKIFKEDQDLFEKTLEFLVKSLTLEKEERACAIQCADTLYTNMNDKKICARIDSYVINLFPYLTSLAETAKLPDVFDVILSFVDNYNTTIGAGILHLLDALVRRINKEAIEKGSDNNVVINKCWNVINTICKKYPKFVDNIEHSLLPIFNYLENPKEIEFDDDIIDVVKILLNIKTKITLNMAKIFPVLPKYFEKANFVFGNLLEVLNCYLFYGKALFGQNKEWIDMLLAMVETSLFVTAEPVEENNAEGALLIQMIMQNLANNIMDPYIPNLFQLILKRLNTKIKEKYLKVQLYNAFLCMVCNNGSLVLSLDKMQLGTFIENIMNDYEKFDSSYNRKVLAIGLSNVLIHCTVPDFASLYFPRILTNIVGALKLQRVEDLKTHISEDQHAINLDESDDQSDSSEDDEDLYKKLLELEERR